VTSSARRHAPPLERGGISLLVLLCAAVFILDVLPLGRLTSAALSPRGVFSPDQVLGILTSQGSLRAIWATLETSFASSVIAVLLGSAVAFATAATDIRGRRPLSFLFVLSLMVAPQVMGLAFLNLTGPSSPLLNALGLAPAPGSPNPLLGRGGIILVMGLHHAPIVFILVAAGLKRIPRPLIEAASVDGSLPWRITATVVAPLMRSHLIGAALLAFVAGIGNFGIAALLGLPVNYLTLPTLIYRRMVSFGPAMLGEMASLGLLTGCIAMLGVLAAQVILRKRVDELEAEQQLVPFWKLRRARLPVEIAFVPFWKLRRARLPVEIALWAMLAVVFLLPALALLAAALVPAYGMGLSLATLTVDNFREVLIRQDVTVRAFRNSFLFAGTSAIVVGFLSIPAAYLMARRTGPVSRLAAVLTEFPYAIPGIVLALALILLFLKPIPGLAISIYGTPWIIVFAYLARFLPVALKPVVTAMSQIELCQEEAAALDGAGLLRRIRTIVTPAILPSVLAGMLLAFLLAFGELTVSALLWSAGTETVGVTLFSLEEAGLASQAAAVGIMTILVVLAVMLVLDVFGSRLPSGTLPWRT
jgi:iron(III) transport system permease protein